MPVAHMVWIKFKPGVDAGRIAHHLDALRGLRGRVPGVLSLHVGENFTDRANGYTHGLLVILESKAALDAYGPHQAHAPVAAALREDADLLAMDFEHD